MHENRPLKPAAVVPGPCPSIGLRPGLRISLLNAYAVGGGETVAANITSSTPIGAVTVFLDGERIDVEVGGQSETRQAFFTSRILSPGTHTVRAVAAGQGAGRAEVQWPFTVVAPTSTPGSPR